MIDRRPASGMGTTHVCGASAVHHFSFGRYQSHERLKWGLLRVLNRVQLESGGKRELYPLGGMEVVIFVEAGAIALHYGDHRAILHNGEVGAVALGLGGDYGFSNVGGSDTRIVEIWLEEDSRSQPRFVHGKVPHGQGILASHLGQDTPVVPLLSHVRLSLLNFERSQSAPVVLDGRHGYGCVTQGSARIGGTSCQSGDGFAILDEPVLEVNATAPCKLLLIETLDREAGQPEQVRQRSS